MQLSAKDGVIKVQGKTETEEGDIFVNAHNEQDGANLVIEQDGKLLSGRDLTMSVYNGDIEVTGNTVAKRNMTVDVENRGNITFGVDVTVAGDIAMQTGTGDILVGRDLTAGGKADLLTGAGNIVVGYNGNGNVKANDDITIKTGGNGDVAIVKTVVSANGSVDIDNQNGNILIGSNGPDVQTVAAKNNVQLSAKDGVIKVQGKTETEEGDIYVSAHSEQDGANLVIEQDGKLLSGRDLTLSVYNGDIEVTGNTVAKRNMTVDVENRGNITFGADVTVAGDIAMQTGTGNILVGRDLTAGGKAGLQTGAGNIVVGYNGNGNVKANQDINIQTGSGNVEIIKTVVSNNGSIDIATQQGDIRIGSNGPDVQTVAAKQNVRLQTGEGQIRIQGKTSTGDGDITVNAGRAAYAAGAQNIVFEADGKLESGKDAYLIATNGDLTVTDDVTAQGTFYAQTKGQGNITLGNDLTVQKDLSMSTDTGDITVGKDVTAAQGSISMQAGMGNIVVGYNGNGNVNAAQDINIQTGSGNVEIIKTVVSNNGSVDIATRQGDIRIGSNGPDVQTVAAKQDVKLQTGEGQIRIQGKTSTEDGDITVNAGRTAYTAGAENIVFEADGKLESGKDAYLIATNGDLTVTDDVTAQGTFYAQTKGQGNITLGNDLTVQKDLSMSTDRGDITVGKDVTAAQGSISMQAGTGNIVVGDNGSGDVKAAEDIRIQTGSGNVEIVKTVVSENGSVDIGTQKGSIRIGSNGPDVQTVAAKNNINISAEEGEIKIQGRTETETGDIYVSAQSKQDNENIVIEQDGKLLSGRDLTLDVYNGDIEVTGNTVAKRNMTVDVENRGNITFGVDITVAGDIAMQTGSGNILVGRDLTAGGKADLQTGVGNIVVGYNGNGNVKADQDINIRTGSGNIEIIKTVVSDNGSVDIANQQGNILIGSNGPDVQTVAAKQDVRLQTNDGQIRIQGKTSTENGDITVNAGRTAYAEANGANNIIFEDDGKLESGKDAYLIATNGDLVVTDDVTAQGTFYAQTKGQGDIMLGRDLSVQKDLSMSTENGDIIVGKAVKAAQGNVTMQAGLGNILVGAEVKAAEDIAMTAGSGDVLVGAYVEAGKNVTVMANNGGSILVGDDVRAGDTATLKVENGDIIVGIDGDGSVMAENDALLTVAREGNISIRKAVVSNQGSVLAQTPSGNIYIGNDPDADMVKAQQNVTLRTGVGQIQIDGGASTVQGDIFAEAGNKTYEEGMEDNIVFGQDGRLNSGNDAYLVATNGDLVVTKNVTAANTFYAQTKGQGNITLGENLLVQNNLALSTETGNITIGNDVTSQQGSVSMQVGTGNIQVGVNGVGSVTAEKDINIAITKGNLDIATALMSKGGSVAAQVENGNIHIGDNGPDVDTVVAKNNVTLATGNGKIEVFGKTATIDGDITLQAASSEYASGSMNIIIAQNGLIDSGQDVYLTGRNGDLHVTDAIKAKRDLYAEVQGDGGLFFDSTANAQYNIKAKTENSPITIAGGIAGRNIELSTGKGDITVGGSINASENAAVTTNNGNISLTDVNAGQNTNIQNTGTGSINADKIISGEITHVSLTNGDLFLNLAEGRAVWVQMENNTAASRVKEIRANASGGTTPDVMMTGNFIQIDSIVNKGGDPVFELSAMGAGNQKLISGNFEVGSLRSASGSHMPTLWANKGKLHVAEGNLSIDDVLAVDKIHLDNDLTDLAIYGRTPTRDGEQLVFWNNLSRAYSKERSFQLYTDGRLRTKGTILIDAGRNYGKLYGDNLSVVDMMRERLTKEHGRFTFDSALLTERGTVLQDQTFFEMEPAAAFQPQSVSDQEIEVDK